MNNGYIKLHRKFRDWYGYKSASRKSLWIELLLRATHADYATVFNGNPIVLHPGQLVAGRKILAEYCDMSESWIEKLLSEFEKVGQIRQQKTNTSRLITIVMWNEYQNSNNGEDNGEDNGVTTKRQRKDTIQECKEQKNGKNKDIVNPIFDNIWLLYPKRLGKKEAQRHFEATVKTDQDLIDIKKAIENYKQSEIFKKGFIQHGSTWFNNWRDWINYIETTISPDIKTTKSFTPMWNDLKPR